MKNTYKRIISSMLVVFMLAGSTLALGGCGLFGKNSGGLFKNYKNGTEAAKLLLANQRLDETVVSSGVDIGLKGTASTAELDSTVLGYRAARSGGASTTKQSWSNFPAFNSVDMIFDSFMQNIESFASRNATEISNMKEKIGIVDRWVGDADYSQMLRVYESRDVLMTRSNDYLEACYRYTDENATNVYEMYSLFDDGQNGYGKVKMVLVPDERYEYFYEHSGGFSDYVIIENSRGYWVCTRFSVHSLDDGSEFAYFESYVIKDGLCYSTKLSDRGDGLTTEAYSIIDLNLGRDILSITNGVDFVTVSLNFSGIKSGLVSVSSNEAYNFNGVYMTGLIDTLVTSKGSYTVNRDGFDRSGNVNFSGGNIDYDFSKELYRGELMFNYANPDGRSVSDLSSLKKYLGEIGLTLYTDFDMISAAINHASLYGDSFGEVFSWNGYTLSDIDKIKEAREVLLDDYAGAENEFKLVEKVEIVPYGAEKRVDLPAFGALSVTSNGNNSYSDGKISLSDISATYTDTTLIQSDEKYLLKVALALCDESGNPIPTNILPLEGGNATAVSGDGESLNLSISGDFTVPKNLAHGKYALVVYAATEGEGIRISTPAVIGSFSPFEGKLESAAMDISLSVADGGFYAEYAIKNTITVSMSATKDSYTYDELFHIITLDVIKRGAPKAGAALETATGGALSANVTLGRGSYRIMCYLPTADGMAEGYVYLEVK